MSTKMMATFWEGLLGAVSSRQALCPLLSSSLLCPHMDFLIIPGSLSSDYISDSSRLSPRAGRCLCLFVGVALSVRCLTWGMENPQVSSQYHPTPRTQFPLSLPPHPLLTDPKPLITQPTPLVATAVLPLTETFPTLEKRFFSAGWKICNV